MWIETSYGKAMKYRPDIDGLRAVAVLSVLFFHYKMLHFRGGFLGVDIFFVISGFLISSIVFAEIETSGRLSLSHFWLRRARRILPALLCVLAVTSLVGGWLFSGTTLMRACATSLLAALFSAANFLFYWQSGYFDLLGITKPLLHTWSLAVEEQFYLFFPLLMWLFLVKIKSGRRLFFAGLAGAFVLSLASCLLLQKNSPDLVFYMLPMRGWELLAGVLLAYVRKENLLPEPGRVAAGILGLACVAALTVCLLYAPHNMGLWNAAAVAASVGLIHCGDGLVNLALSQKPLVFVGRISYSLYLWHWPPLVFLSFYQEDLTNADRLCLLAFSFGAAWLSFRFVEQPFRRPGVGWRQVAARLLPVALCLCAAGLAGMFAPQRSRFETPDMALVASLTPPQLLKQEAKVYEIGVKGRHDFLVVGDSHAQSVIRAASALASECGVGGELVWIHGLFVPKLQSTPEYEKRNAYAEKALAYINAYRPRAILLAHFWHVTLARRASLTYDGKLVKNKERLAVVTGAITEQLRAWLDMGITIYIMEQAPDHPYPSIEMASRLTRTSPTEPYDATVPALRRIVSDIGHPNLRLIRIEDIFREKEGFAFIRDGRLLYFDSTHINYFGEQMVKERLRPFFQRAAELARSASPANAPAEDQQF
jgi:peptidoglycan/LPS O-acetylase OafA/YrhL